MAITITVTITDEDTLENYKDVHPEIIVDDFITNASTWFPKADVTCVNTEFKG